MDARLVSLSKRINAGLDRIDEERKSVADIYQEAKSAGYIPKILRKAITRQRMNAAKRQEEDSILELYDHALGNLGAALRAISEGATWEEAGAANGVPRATLARAAAVSKRREMIPEGADPETGEIIEETADRKPSGGEPVRAETEAASGQLPATPTDARTFDEIVGEMPAHLRRVKAA